MAFNMSYKGLTDRNIKHIYSDQTITFVTPRKQHFRPLKEERQLPPLKRYPKRFYDYYARYNIGIPRAPAFRGTDPEMIEQIVNRICKPIECQKYRRRDLQEESEQDEVKNSGAKDDEDEDAASERKRKSQEIAAMVARLQKPTESWKYKRSCRHGDGDQETPRNNNVTHLPPIEC